MTTFPGIAGQIEQVIGCELTAILLRRWGGCQINLPARAKGSKLAEVVGEDAAQRIIDSIGHGKITLPCGSLRGIGRRRAQAIEMLRKGASLADVALACDLHTRTVSNYRAQIEVEDGARQFQLPFDR
jgi:hypothetical protein